MVESIIAAIVAIFQAIPIFAKWFPPKTAEQKVEDGAADVRKEIDDFKKSGRPE